MHRGKILLFIFCILPAFVQATDAYDYLKKALAQGEAQRAKKTLGIIGTKITRKNDRQLYYRALVNFIDGNYSQVRMDLDQLSTKTNSPYLGKLCHLKWMNELYLSDVNELNQVMKLCTGVLAQENTPYLFWHTRTTQLKIQFLKHPWTTETMSFYENLLAYRPLMGDLNHESKLQHLRQWYKLNYFHHRELNIQKYFRSIPEFYLLDEEIAEISNVIRWQQGPQDSEQPEQSEQSEQSENFENSEINATSSEIMDLNLSVVKLKPLITQGSWIEAITTLESLWSLYPYSYNINSMLALLYWLSGKNQESVQKIQHLNATFQNIPSDLVNLSATVLMQAHRSEESKQILYDAPRPDNDHTSILKNNLWQWIGIDQNNQNLVFQAASNACDLGDKESCPLSYSYWRKTNELSGTPPSID
ncbi:MAG: hypothetical protein QE271_00135 [Bacteriovoracaceae bacterium]|nr:hypothetical protein [Bacteriovoracaceae bacterium]